MATDLLFKNNFPIGPLTSYTPTTQGIGTASSVDFVYQEMFGWMTVQGELTTGTVTADELQIGLPSGWQMDSAAYGSIKVVGWCVRATQNPNRYSCLATGGDTYFNFGILESAGLGGLAPAVGSGVLGSSEIFTFFAFVKVVRV